MARRRALSLVEVLLAATVALVLFGVTWSLLGGGVRQFAVSQSNLEAIAVAQTVLETVQDSLNAMIIDAGAPSTLLDAGAGPQPSLEFNVCRADPGGAYRGVRARFGSQAEPGGRWRCFVHDGQVHENLSLESLTFETVSETGIAGLPLFFVVTRVTAVNPVRAESEQRRAYTLVGVTALTNQTRTLLGRRWNPNPYVYKRF